MTVAAVPGFSDFGGAHCETSTARKVLAHHGIMYSEAMLFGLAGGIGFLYWETPGMGRPFIGGRNGKSPDFVVRMGEATGNPIGVTRTRSAAKARRKLRLELEAGRPAACYGDIYHLPYFRATRHFGGHAFIVHGIDEDLGVAMISDTVPGSQTIPLAALERARGSEDQPFQPRHGTLTVDIRTDATPSAETIRGSIRFCRDSMTRPPMRKLGLPGLACLADDMEHWLGEMEAEALVERLADLYHSLELAGTGGLGFRRLYRRFLDEVADVLPTATATTAIGRLDQVIVAWEEMIEALLPDTIPSLGLLRNAMKARSAAAGTPSRTSDENAGRRARLEAVEALTGPRNALAPLPGALRAVAEAERRFFATLEPL